MFCVSTRSTAANGQQHYKQLRAPIDILPISQSKRIEKELADIANSNPRFTNQLQKDLLTILN